MQQMSHQDSALLPSPQFEIRPVSGIDDLEDLVAFQRIVWGYGDLDVESRSILTVASRFSGQVIGAYSGTDLIGFSLAFGTMQPGRLHSHRVGVLREFQNLGVGRALKLAQREHALKLGTRIIQWTFDPLQSRNAYFNLRKLGGVARTFLPNLYGITSSPLHGGLPTDRLLIEWEIESDRVQKAIAGSPTSASSSAICIPLAPLEQRGDPSAQALLRESFLEAFNAGYTLTSFETVSEQQAYILEKL